MLFNILGCYMVVVQLASPYELPKRRLLSSVNTCMEITYEAELQGAEYLRGVYLALAWQESRFTMDAKGKWICTGRGKVVMGKDEVPKCTSGKLTRARGPMQILPVYHCKGEANCNYLNKAVSLLSGLVADHGVRRGLEIYAGGFSGSKRSIRYALMTMWRARKIDATLDFLWDLRLLIGVSS